MKKILIKNAKIVNENEIKEGDLYIEGKQVVKLDNNLSQKDNHTEVIDAEGKYLLPGVIDDQVHFREPGLTHKATIESESRAAIAGGVTSFIEQPNTIPHTTTIELLEDKYTIAQHSSWANYAFNLGATNDNIEEIKRANPSKIPGIKVFMGGSTGNMLVNDDTALNQIFEKSPLMIITHCEDEHIITFNRQRYSDQYGDDIPVELHPIIRSREACIKSSKRAIEFARKHNSRLHIYHISTAEETELFSNEIPLKRKKITAEACIHHLWFNQEEYKQKGNLIKWNPAVKSEEDRKAILKAVIDDRIDVIATDHAPHALEEKKNVYTKVPSGGPLVQHALPAMMEFVHKGKMSLEKLVEKMCHNPAILFGIKGRGFIREGYFADLVLIDAFHPLTVNKDNILYQCRWSPFEDSTFSSRITHTFVNGQLVYERGRFYEYRNAQRLEFLC